MAKKGIVLGYLVFVILAICLYFYFNQVRPVEKGFELKKIVIEKGEGVQEIAEKLEDEGLVRNSKFFEIFAFLKNVRSKFWPGEYYLSPNMSLKELIQILTSQHLSEERTITIIEGWTTQEIADYLARENIVSRDDFFTGLREFNDENYEFLHDNPEGAGLEGYLFPDTYRVYKETTARVIIEKMLKNFGQKLDASLRAKIKNQNRTIFETLTMASLVEKEAASDLERRVIADIFWRRLANDIPLQSCASVNYILGTSKHQLSYEETRTVSAYNTYLNRGLPPGPINNPGLNAIQAAIEPVSTDYWYFLAGPQGETIFSRTIDEHNKNKAEYLK